MLQEDRGEPWEGETRSQSADGDLIRSFRLLWLCIVRAFRPQIATIHDVLVLDRPLMTAVGATATARHCGSWFRCPPGSAPQQSTVAFQSIRMSRITAGKIYENFRTCHGS